MAIVVDVPGIGPTEFPDEASAEAYFKGGNKKSGALDTVSNIPILSELASFGYGVGEKLTPGMGTIRKGIHSLMEKATGEKSINEQLQNAIVGESPTANVLGEASTDMVRSIAGYTAGTGILGKLIPAVTKGGVAGNLLNILRGAGIGGASNVASSQLADPDIDRAKTDATIGAVLGGVGATAKALKPAAKKWASNLYSSVLKRSRPAIEAEAKRGLTLEQKMAERGVFGGTVDRLAKKSGKMVGKLEEKISPMIDSIKAKVKPVDVIDELKVLRGQYVGPNGFPVSGMEKQVQVVDDMIKQVGQNYGKAGWLTARQATDLKRKLYHAAKKVLETTETGPITKEAQMAQAIGWKSGVEKAADSMGSKLGKTVADLNKEQGFWLGLEKAANQASARSGKTFFGKYVIPTALVGGGGALGTRNKGAGAGMTAMGLAMTPMGRLLLASMVAKGSNVAPKVGTIAPIISQLVAKSKQEKE